MTLAAGRPSETVLLADPLESSVLTCIGSTPLVRLRRFEPRAGIEIYAKLESRNPGGSVKDRAAARIIQDALRSGGLRPGRGLLDATSGNTGIAYAMLGAALNFPVTLCVPSNVSQERKQLLQAYGAEIVWTDPLEGSDGAIRRARKLAAEEPTKYYYADQYNNDANWRAHYETTAVEILEQTGGRVTHFVAGLGTSGTFMGTGRRLKHEKPDVTLVSIQPDSAWHGLEGLKHMETAIVPGIYDPALADVDLRVETEAASAIMRRLAREEGILVGMSGAAGLVGVLRTAAPLERAVLVTVFPDGGERYLSDSPLSRDASAAREDQASTQEQVVS